MANYMTIIFYEIAKNFVGSEPKINAHLSLTSEWGYI